MTGDPRKQHLDIGIDMSPGEKDINMDVASPPPPDYQQNQQNMRLTQQDFTDSEQKELVEKHLWYVVPVHNYTLYKNIAKGNNTLQPQKLDCSCLLEKSLGSGKFLLKRNIQENIDYTLCSSELFNKIQAQYQVVDMVRDVIQKEVIKEGKYRQQLAIELHPLILQTSQFRAYDDENSQYKPPSNKIKLGPSSVIVETTKTTFFEISTAATLKSLRKVIAEIYEIADNDEFDLYLRFEQPSDLNLSQNSPKNSPKSSTSPSNSPKRTNSPKSNSPIHSKVPEYTPLDNTVDINAGLQTDLGLTDNTSIIVIDMRKGNFRSRNTIWGEMNSDESESNKRNTQISIFQEFNQNSDQAVPGQTGLSNLGNTCFMASGLQCMSSVPILTEYFLQDAYKHDLNRDNPLGCQGRLAEEYAHLLRELWSGQNKSVQPRTFKKTLAQFSPRFTGYQQQDSHEFLAFLLDGIHEDLNRIKKKPYIELKDADGRSDAVVSQESWNNHLARNNSVITDNFHGQFKSTVKCPCCDRFSITFDPFCYLTLPLNTSGSSILSGLSKFSGASIFNKLKAEKDKKSEMAENVSLILLTSSEEDAKRYGNGNWILELQVSMVDLLKSQDNNDQVAVKLLKTHLIRILNKNLKDAIRREKRNASSQSNGENSNSGSKGHSSTEMQDQSDHQASDNHCSEDEKSKYDEFSLSYENVIVSSVINGQIDQFWNDEDYINLEKLPHSIDKNCMSGLAVYVIADIDVDNDQLIPVYFQNEKKASKSGFGMFKGDKTGEGGQELVTFPVLIKIPKSQVWYKDIRSAIDKQIFPKFREARNYDSEFTQQNIQFDLAMTKDMRKTTEIEDQNRNMVQCGSWQEKKYKLIAEYNNISANCYAKAMKILVSQGSVKKAGTGRDSNLNSLAKCIEQFLMEEELEEEDAWYCPDCKSHQQASKKFDLWKLPPVLTIQLKRFGTQRYMFSSRRKVKTKIDFPMENLKLDEFVTGEIDRKNPPTYSLIGVSNHMGEMGFGHYTAYCRSVRDNSWYCYDDSCVRKVSESEVCSPSAYVLFYCQTKLWEEWLEKGRNGID